MGDIPSNKTSLWPDMQKSSSLCESGAVSVLKSCLDSDSLEDQSSPHFWTVGSVFLTCLPCLCHPGLGKHSSLGSRNTGWGVRM